MIHLIGVLATVITLTVTPTSGKAPLTVHPVITLTGGAKGEVCIGVEQKSDPEQYINLGCQEVNIEKTEIGTLQFETTGGTAGNTYTFIAAYLPEGGTEATTSNTIEVRAE